MRVNMSSGDVEDMVQKLNNPSSIFVSKIVDEFGVLYDQVYYIEKGSSLIGKLDTKTGNVTTLVVLKSSNPIRLTRLVVNRGMVYFGDSNRIMAFNISQNQMRNNSIATFDEQITDMTINLNTNEIFVVLKNNSLYSVHDEMFNNIPTKFLFSLNITNINQQMNEKVIIRSSTNSQDHLYAFYNQRIYEIYKNGTSKAIIGSGRSSNVHGFGPVLNVELALISDMYIGNNVYIAYKDSIMTVINGNVRRIFSSNGVSIDGLPMHKFGFSNIEKVTLSRRYRNLYVSDGFIIRNVSLTDGKVSSIESSSSEISSSQTVIYNELGVGKDETLYVTSTDPETSVTSLEVINGKSSVVLIDSSRESKHADGIDALTAVLDTPFSIHREKNGDIYFSETGNHLVRKITKDGKIYVVAGNGKSGFSGDGGKAIHAQLNKPKGITIVGDFIYICDFGNGVIRNISIKTGMIETFAGVPHPIGNENLEINFEIPKDGKPRSEIWMNGPTDLEYSQNFKTFYLTDTLNHRILSFPLEKNDYGHVFAGSGYQGYRDDLPLSSLFSQPYGLLCVDREHKESDLYIVDSENHKIRKIIIRDGQAISLTITIAGRRDGFSGDGGFALNARLLYPTTIEYYKSEGQDGLLFISDTYNNRIRMININTNIISTEIGSGSSGFNTANSPEKIKINGPKGLFVSDDVLYFCDSRNNRIMGMNLTGEYEISLIAGKLFQLRYVKKWVYYLGGNGNDNTTQQLSIAHPLSVIFDSSANEVIFTDDILSNIRKIDSKGMLTTLAGNGDIGKGNDNVKAIETSLNNPTGLILDKNGELIFCDMMNDRICELNSNGTIITISGDGLESPFSPILNLDYQLLVLDKFGKRISLIKPSTKIETIANLNQSAFDLEFDPVDGSLIYCTRSAIYKLIPHCEEEGYKLNNHFTSCLAECYGKTTDACSGSGRGICIIPNQCQCNEGYTGKECEIPICNNLTNVFNNSNVCNGRGKCIDFNSCQCVNSQYEGSDCEIATCYGQSGPSACGGVSRGHCSDIDQCTCIEKQYTGNQCQHFVCFGYSQEDPRVCNGKGKCVGVDSCNCTHSYGKECREELIDDQSRIITIVSIVLSVVFVFLISLLVLLFIFFCRKYGKQKKIIGNADSLSKQLLLDDDYHHLELQDVDRDHNSDYIIPIKDLDLSKRKRLGKGGQGLVVESIWKGITVAVKVFEMESLMENQEFLNEVKIIVKLRHPNIIYFYGVSIMPNKGFIVMEKLNKSLSDVIYELEKANESITFDKKLSMILGIARGIEYLHSLQPRPIVHRDLKPGNILLDKDDICKLCDFGLSRKMSDQTSVMTHLIGTQSYMSPELMLGTIQDAKSCDVYAFGIIMWQLLFECQDPYTYTETKTLQRLNLKEERKYASSPLLTSKICNENLRPIIPFDSKVECQKWCENYQLSINGYDSDRMYHLCQLIKECWRSDEMKRPPIFTIIGRIEAILLD